MKTLIILLAFVTLASCTQKTPQTCWHCSFNSYIDTQHYVYTNDDYTLIFDTSFCSNNVTSADMAVISANGWRSLKNDSLAHKLLGSKYSSVLSTGITCQ